MNDLVERGREAARTMRALLEPIVRVEVETPSEFQGGIVGDLSSRRGLVFGTELKQNTVTITAEVPLANMFGYATDLRSATQGKGTFSMEFACYRRVPQQVQEEIVVQHRKELAEKS